MQLCALLANLERIRVRIHCRWFLPNFFRNFLQIITCLACERAFQVIYLLTFC